MESSAEAWFVIRNSRSFFSASPVKSIENSPNSMRTTIELSFSSPGQASSTGSGGDEADAVDVDRVVAERLGRDALRCQQIADLPVRLAGRAVPRRGPRVSGAELGRQGRDFFCPSVRGGPVEQQPGGVLTLDKSDTMNNTALIYDVTLRVYDRAGSEIAQTSLHGRDNLGGSFWNPPSHAKQAVPSAFAEKLADLFADPEIERALR